MPTDEMKNYADKHLEAHVTAAGGTVYALFTRVTHKRHSQWYYKLGAAQYENERQGKRFIIYDNHGKVWSV